MTEYPRLRADRSSATSPSDGGSPDQPSALPSAAAKSSRVLDISRTLAAHGAGAASVDLAFDLVLHEVVAHARDATRATGAAIALIRDGEMVCRATTGQSAPDLGVRVDTGSGLAGASVSTGKIQNCQDTETDSRVNAEACRTLGVRSMLIAPIFDAQEVFGILQVFSPSPGAFGEKEVDALHPLVERVVDSRREALAGITVGSREESSRKDEIANNKTTQPLDVEGEATGRAMGTDPSKASESWTTILFILVLAAAVVLGMVVGWRGGMRERKLASVPGPSAGSPGAATLRRSPPESAATLMSGSAADSKAAASGAETKPLVGVPSRDATAGGLVITQNGRVIYQTAESPTNAGAGTSQKKAPLLHRVEPEYPAEARAQHIQGAVVLDVRILADGRVGDVMAVSGDQLLVGAAVQAVKQWRFRPYLESGKAAESEVRITINFTMPSA